ncbi:MAG: PEGA domain-containing protein [Sandaracinaceae bacterium]
MPVARLAPLFASIAAMTMLSLALAPSHADAQRRRGQGGRPGTLVIRADVEGAEIFVDEESRGVTPVDPISLPAGRHTVRARRPGYTEFDDVVQITANRETELDVPMIALAMVVTVRSTPEEARVFVDDSFRGNTPIELELSEGNHQLRVTAPGHMPLEREVVARPGQTELMELTLEPVPEELLHPDPPEWYEEPLTWILVGAGAAVVAAAIIVIAVLATQTDQLTDFCGENGMLCDAQVMIAAPIWRF